MDNYNNVVKLDPHRQSHQPAQPKPDTDDLLKAAEQFLDANPMREVLRLGCYFLKRTDGSWFPIKPGHLVNHFPEWSQPKFRVAVTMKLQERGWTYNDVTYTFRRDLPPDLLNLLDRSGWLEPDVGEYHWIFDVLVQSHRRQQGREHGAHQARTRLQVPLSRSIHVAMLDDPRRRWCRQEPTRQPCAGDHLRRPDSQHGFGERDRELQLDGEGEDGRIAGRIHGQ